jgi:hypothetical protein
LAYAEVEEGRMLESVARVPTQQPERYIKQVVSHLGHKRTTEMLADGHGVVHFEDGRCTLVPEAGVLVLAASAVDEEALSRVQDVIARHLERFGTREGLAVRWSAGQSRQ